MSGPPPLPDLKTLTDGQKDALIVGLWKTLAAAEAAAAPAGSAQVGPATVADLRARISDAKPSKRGLRRTEAGRRRRGRPSLLESGLVIGVLCAIGAGFIADWGVGWRQQHALDLRRRSALELENAAFAGLYVELARVGYDPDGKSYRAVLTMQNANAGAPLYVLLSPARVFVQVGLVWQAVTTRTASGASSSVVKLDGAHEIELAFQVDAKNWTELIPGYMHMRIQSDMLISRESEPKDDIVARANRFNVYLKPRDADDAEIKRRLNFSGSPPLFIPMPPH